MIFSFFQIHKTIHILDNCLRVLEENQSINQLNQSNQRKSNNDWVEGTITWATDLNSTSKKEHTMKSESKSIEIAKSDDLGTKTKESLKPKSKVTDVVKKGPLTDTI